MKRERAEAVFIDEGTHYSVTEMVTLSGLDSEQLAALVDCGALVPDDVGATQLTFGGWSIEIARRARHLREEFALDDTHAVAILVRFDQRVRELEHALAALRARSGTR